MLTNDEFKNRNITNFTLLNEYDDQLDVNCTAFENNLRMSSFLNIKPIIDFQFKDMNTSE
jgi:hypothetical protein